MSWIWAFLPVNLPPVPSELDASIPAPTPRVLARTAANVFVFFSMCAYKPIPKPSCSASIVGCVLLVSAVQPTIGEPVPPKPIAPTPGPEPEEMPTTPPKSVPSPTTPAPLAAGSVLVTSPTIASERPSLSACSAVLLLLASMMWAVIAAEPVPPLVFSTCSVSVAFELVRPVLPTPESLSRP
jgi:hypothetical protein